MIIQTILTVLFALLFNVSANAAISSNNTLTIDFTKSDDAKNKSTWSEPDIINITAEGIGWDGECTSQREGWIQTTPLAVGLSWRPASQISVCVSTYPGITALTRSNGEKYTPYLGNPIFVRYSPDLQHWSTWQVLQAKEPLIPTDVKNSGRHYIVGLCVPNIERENYSRLISEYAKLDVPWKSNEDAAVRWILKKEPEFFNKQLPFIGYIQFRYEGPFYGGQRITSFKADASYAISGMHQPPRDNKLYKRNALEPWSFKAE